MHSAPRGVRFIVNDRPDIALLAGAGGVHVGQEDLGVEEARAICGRERWVGVSTHTLEQVEAADRTSADYIAFGPIFPTTTKQNPDAVVGTELAAPRAADDGEAAGGHRRDHARTRRGSLSSQGPIRWP